MPTDLSPIQNHIISRLKNANVLRYSELQPPKVPNDLFNYHLQQLVKKGFIDRDDDGYSLSKSGIKLVADPYTKNDGISSLFKVNVITIVSRLNEKGQIEILNQLRMSNPSYGKVGVMGGVVQKGEMIELAATRKLKQETGLDASFRLVACERRVMYKGGELFSDVMFPISYTASASGDLLEQTPFGKNFWVPIEEAIKNESAEFDSIKTIATVLQAVRDGTIKSTPFRFEESVQSDTDFKE